MIYKMQFKRYILIHLSVTYQLPYARLCRSAGGYHEH